MWEGGGGTSHQVIVFSPCVLGDGTSYVPEEITFVKPQRVWVPYLKSLVMLS